MCLTAETDTSLFTSIAGKLAASDFFDGNALSQDPRTEFQNWALMLHFEQ